ncbi:hypothetical protein KP509_06G019000 [Ceratopteris richardii]|uniref:Ras-related protein Rab-34 n=1 Tax=Ceratopteris richardii TaxID=49495 RepID=A0A8T2UKW6_CERRI|nr:hypothetical protein KP509_06G019000 [Ceratopteris richardii]
MAMLPLHLEYVAPGRGGDLSIHKCGQEGFKKVVEDFTSSLSTYDRRSLQLEEKVIIVGDTRVGKSCLLARFMNDSYTDSFESTIGLDFHKQVYTHAGLSFTLCIWDTAGQERFRAVSNHFYRGAQACIAAFDLGVPLTLSHVKQWVDKVKKENTHPSVGEICVFLVGCKSDMFHTVSYTQAQHVAAELNAEYFEVSAKSGFNVKTLFERVACLLFERALLRQMKEWQEERTAKVTSEGDASEDLLLGNLSSGRGMDNWKVVKDSSDRSRCCGRS